MQQNHRGMSNPWIRRTVSTALSLAVLAGSVPPLPIFALDTSHWSAEYLQKLVDWGVMRDEQADHPDRAMTRAEFMGVVNRAYGYTDMGSNPFEDVLTTDWFYEDVCIAYKANYIHGTSATTASPNDTLTRETATFVLGKNMMMKETPGENLEFADGREVSDWSRGVVRTAVKYSLVSGYEDNTFRPTNAVSVGEVAALISSCIGTPISESGEYSLGSVFGNVTITASDVTLKDTIISGDLYITGGVGKGDVLLENVTVLGRIIDSGTGESEAGEVSVLMRNVVADELLVDNLSNDYVTIRAEGSTMIDKINVRTPSYLEDMTPQGKGLLNIVVDGEDGTDVDLAGRIKNVTTKTPNSVIRAAKGTIQTLTVDELAVGAQVRIDRAAEVKELNLDVSSVVSGSGDIEKLVINSSGCVVEPLPDNIVIRPGLTASVGGQTMDTVSAEESSRDPKILSGYPVASDVSPTNFYATFATNKKGTVYWAVSSITNGSVDAAELITPSSYGSIAVKSGSVAVSGADVKVQAKVDGLTIGGSYYLSAVFVDDRGQQSPVKVTAFTTPDNSKPDFVSGYPYISLATMDEAQVVVMPTKTCKMYYALLEKGAVTPTPDEFKAYSISGYLGMGVIDLEKNTSDTVKINDKLLDELTEYDLFLWLTDADGVNSSDVKKVSFKTVDETPPKFIVEPTVNKVEEKSVGLNFTLNEDGTFYWAVVEENAEYPKPNPTGAEEGLSDEERWKGSYAKLQVASGLNALQSGKVNATKDKNTSVTVSNLEPEKAYDFWYVAQDKAGNYSVSVQKITIHTLDNSAPKVKQYFTKYSGSDNTKNPMPDTDIVLEFSENIRYTKGAASLLDLYQNVVNASPNSEEQKDAKKALAKELESIIHLYHNLSTGKPELVKGSELGKTGDDWTINYHEAQVTSKNSKVSVVFPGESALNLASGGTYYFELTNITDTSNNQNPIAPDPMNYGTIEGNENVLPQFTTVFAEIFVGDISIGTGDLPSQRVDGAIVTKDGKQVKTRMDYRFRLDPQTTEKVEDEVSYDILLWADTVVSYDLYCRVVDKKTGQAIENPEEMSHVQNKTADEAGWLYLGNSGLLHLGEGETMVGRSVNQNFNLCDSAGFPKLNGLSQDRYYDFVVSLTQVNTSTEYATWSGDIEMRVDVAAGISGNLYSLSRALSLPKWETYYTNGLHHSSGAESIGITAQSKKFYEMSQSFQDTETPEFDNNKPFFKDEKGNIGDSFVDLQISMNRKGTVYYVIAKEGVTQPKDKNGQVVNWKDLPEDGQTAWSNVTFETPLKVPDAQTIQQASTYYNNVSNAVYGTINYPTEKTTVTERVKGLLPDTNYIAYFVLKGASPDISEVYAYRFTTNSVTSPKIKLENLSTGEVQIETQVDAKVDYIMYTNKIILDSWGKTMLENNLAEGVTLPDAYKGMNILDAMKESYSYSVSRDDAFKTEWDNFSVFDIYASDAIKKRIAEVIRGHSGSASAMNEMLTSAEEVHRIDERSRLESNTYYWLLAVGHHQSTEDGEVDRFKALDNILIPDVVPPELTGYSEAIWSNTDGTYSGKLTLNFSKAVYWSEDNSKGKPVPVYYLSSDTDVYERNELIAVSFLGRLGGSMDRKNLSIVGPEKRRPSQDFVIGFDHVRVGEGITMFDDGKITNSSGVATDDRVIIALSEKITENESGLPIKEPCFVVMWGGSVVQPTTSSTTKKS